MKSEDVGSLPIVEDGRLVGVVTDRDLAIRILAEGKGADTPVGEIASKDVVTVDPQQSLEEAARLMAEHQVRRLPVTEEDGKLVGILAQADVAQAGDGSPARSCNRSRIRGADAEQIGQRQEREAVRGAEGQGYVEGARGQDRELA